MSYVHEPEPSAAVSAATMAAEKPSILPSFAPKDSESHLPIDGDGAHTTNHPTQGTADDIPEYRGELAGKLRYFGNHDAAKELLEKSKRMAGSICDPNRLCST
jgi:hypothetical protein